MMGTKRNIIDRTRPGGGRITDAVVKAWHDCDGPALHSALALTPWSSSPFPSQIYGLGVDPGPAPAHMDGFRRVDWRRAQKTQSQLLEACGWPKNCRRAYRNNLAEALRWWRYCKSLIDHPELGPVKGSTGTDPASRQQALEEADADVEYRRRLLVNLAEA